MSKSWEYRVENIPQAQYVNQALNNIGGEGWELVAIVGQAYYFKKEKVEARKAPEVKQFTRDGHSTGHPIG
jgi:hypothetical protein